MNRFVAKRLLFLVPQLFIVAVGTFLLLRALPVDPVSKAASALATEEGRAQARAQLGLDRSLGDQMGTYLGGLVKGDFGVSWTTNEPVRTEIADRFPITIQLIVLAFVLALAIAIPVGRAAAARPGGRTDKGVMGYSLFAGAQPDFWWGLLFIYLLFFKAGIFPAPLGLLSPDVAAPPDVTNFILIDAVIAGDWTAFLNALEHLALPVITIAFVLSGPLIKMTRQSVLGVAESDFILYERASGLPSKRIKRDLLRNGIAPVITWAGIFFGFMLGGAVLVETVFSLDGLGVYALQRTLALDFPAIQGAVVVMTAFALVIYLAMDVLYAALDPRVRY